VTLFSRNAYAEASVKAQISQIIGYSKSVSTRQTLI